MKRLLIIASTLLFSGCSHESITSNNHDVEIAFKNNYVTKGVLTSSYTVLAYGGKDQTSSPAYGNQPPLFIKNYDSNNEVLEGGDQKPFYFTGNPNDKYTFIAYSPLNDQLYVSVIPSFVSSDQYPTQTQSPVLLYQSPANGQLDLKISSPTPLIGGDKKEALQLAFKNMMTQVKFRVRKPTDKQASTKLYSVTYSVSNSNATFDLTLPVPSADFTNSDQQSIKYEFFKNDQGLDVTSQNNVIASTMVDAPGVESLYVLPQPLATEQDYIQITYSIQSDNSNAVQTKRFPLTSALVRNQIRVYDITLAANVEITFSTDVIGWDDATQWPM